MFQITKDGAFLFKGTHAECMAYIHTHTPFSVDHAMRYEGYDITEL